MRDGEFFLKKNKIIACKTGKHHIKSDIINDRIFTHYYLDDYEKETSKSENVKKIHYLCNETMLILGITYQQLIKTMKRAYQYLFYKLNSYMLRTPNRQNALDGAVALISIIDLFFVIDLFVIFSKCISYIKSISDNTLIISGLIIAFLIYLINAKYFKKYILEIKAKFDQENNIQKWVGRIFVLIVGIGSIGSLIAIGLLFK